MGTDAFSPQRPESFHYFLLLSSRPLVYYRKPTNLRISFGASASQFQPSDYGYVVMPEHVHFLLSEPERDTSYTTQAKIGLEWAAHLFGKARGRQQFGRNNTDY
jgi:REP element-mobilizing transposase RayT